MAFNDLLNIMRVELCTAVQTLPCSWNHCGYKEFLDELRTRTQRHQSLKQKAQRRSEKGPMGEGAEEEEQKRDQVALPTTG